MNDSLIEKVHEVCIENRTNIRNIREDLTEIKEELRCKFDEYDRRINSIENMKKYVVGIVTAVTIFLTALINWVLRKT